MINKQLGIKLSALTLALVLAGCGGGGSDGYYNNSNSTPENSNVPKDETEVPLSEQSFIQIESSQPTLDINGDNASITIRLSDKNGGGVANKPVTLVLDENAQKNGLVNAEVSTKNTDSNGYATFTVSLKQAVSETVISDLLNNGVNLSALYTEADKTQAIQTLNLRVIDSESSIETALYNLRVKANKQLLNVKGDNALITVQVVNNNGAVISGKNVTLKVLDAKNNFVTLTKDNDVSDTLGETQFEIAIPANLTSEQKNLLLTNNIQVEASITDENNISTTQNFTLRVTASEGTEATPNITFGRTQQLSTVNDGLDYQEILSVRVVDKDGNPIPDTDFTINMQVIQKASGHFVIGKSLEGALAIDKATLANEIQFINTTINNLNSQKATADPDELDEIIEKINLETEKLKNIMQKKAVLDVYEIPKRIQYTCTAEKPETYIATQLSGSQMQNIANTYTATTDKDGQFKFNITFFKTHAAWQTVRLNVAPKNSLINFNMAYDYPLNFLKSDFESEDPQPFDFSPYNLHSLISPCPTVKPWSNLL
ncbi:Ig-like domain-containing protein [Acinetobacter schindleri]|uniref:Ig-like domain-containing protein n=1 Tax=Acinetobacter schindleri TaxID=108981 RepID=UPI0032B52943